MTADVAREMADRYDREARAYRDLWGPLLRPAGLRLLDALAGEPARRVIDVGAGVGGLEPGIRNAFPDAFVFGLDRSPGMLALAPGALHRAVADGGRLAVGSASVDLVLFVFVLFHLNDPVDGLREARRVLRPGGRVATLTWAGEFESEASRRWSACLDEHGAAPPDPAADARHAPVDSAAKVAALLEGAGFEAIRAWEEELVGALELEPLLALKTSMGRGRARFQSLDASARDACLDAARRRLQSLGPRDFEARGNVVYAIARTR